jgi:ethanolamine utilization protein EutN
VKLGRVTGTVVSTVKAPIFDGRTLLLVDLLNPDGTAGGGYLIAVDTVGAGVGETVLLLDEGGSARQVIGETGGGPLRTVVVGIVDAVEGPAAGARAAGAPAASTGRQPQTGRRSRRGEDLPAT